ncbi:MAG: hypothetical protein HC831_14065 [Chloroflexia bacterium]|nr:hypothetical protein [Chloroflexia bacterium]
MVNNLLSNAIKFSKEGSKIEIDLLQIGNSIQLKIKDQGKGMMQEELTQIFERFYRAGSQKESEGSGIGLSLTKELVELHNGEILVESEPGEGTTFTVILPAIRQNTTALKEYHVIDYQKLKNTENVSKIEQTNQQTETVVKSVLIVEDNVDMQHYIASCLKDYKIHLRRMAKKVFQLLLKLILI